MSDKRRLPEQCDLVKSITPESKLTHSRLMQAQV
jgi:hypothetical protein